ncbi:wax ester/triacylglycerol synthase family O-acyltransferase [Tenacibaculum sp. 1_MG-2023]|uniref:wax ester/triacylglycerol synthase family O-acyltransferase n=1 Tax=Tenacibaculum sp. 1_MG-2023 TaxID=3062653 RepID=UPI0026E21410|nr:wax ester/triacylglycerol synthase family O-acyltransferase [Tenacibaculum sp. 1_MG-2023]MDO6598819.1 wax ester/triacylglycerol synthase family O-acyltransferase [Tenacibaculum sp. 1_MG-2023]
MAKKVIKDLLEDALDSSIKQISGQDAAFLYAESALNPMHIGTLIIVEDSLKFDDFKETIASKLHLMPKFRQRLLNVPFDLDYPYWVDDPNFELDLHLNRIKLPDPADWKTLRDTTATVFSASLDLRRPLWSITFIEGLDTISQIPKGSVAILTKVHHVMIDGASGVGLMGMLFDKNKENSTKPIPKPKPFEPEPLPEELSLLLKSSYKFFKDPLKLPKLIGEAAVSVMQQKAKKAVVGNKPFDKKSFSVPKTIFNGSISPKRTWGTAILSFDRINMLRKIMGVTINDVIVNICAGAIRRYLIEKDQLPSLPLVANVPISIRVKGEKQNFDNKISNMLVQIGTHIEDPIERLEYIQEQTEMGKSRHKAVGAKSLMKMAEIVPFGLANLASGIYSKYNIKELHRPPFNVTITNVPGPQTALYLKGHKTVGVFGLTPVVDGFGLIIAAFSYNGTVSITTTSDANTMPDADKFSRLIREEANALEKVILKKGKQKEKEIAKVTLASSAFFSAFKRFIKSNAEIVKKHKGLYQFEVTSKNESHFWSLDFTQKEGILKKKKERKAKASFSIDDTNLIALHQQKFLLQELVIQGRMKFEGDKKHQDKLISILSEFLNR